MLACNSFILEYRDWRIMSSDNIIKNRIEAADANGSTLDESVKKVLAIKPILARILQGCVKEFENLPIADIENKYIEGTPSIACEAVHEDETVPVITGTNTEHKSINEGTVTFDLKFNAYVPKSDETMQMIINVEGQNNASYPILKRGIYYCGRMLSAQYGTIFTESHYEKLRKVVSIWVCFAGNQKQQNTINRYVLQEKALSGAFKASEEEYNLLEVIMVYLGDDDKTDNKLLKMLDKIFSEEYNVGEKISYLQDECGIDTTSNMNEEVDGMCNYSEYVRDKGRAEGMDIVNKLTALLLEAKRFDDLKRSTEDRDFQNQLLQEFGLA